MSEERTHAKLSPSASGRWMNCAGSVEVNSVRRRSNFYAEEGTAAHALFDLCMSLDVDPDKFLGTFIYKDFEVTDEMADAVGQAVDWVRAYLARYPKAKYYTEKKVDPFKILKCEKDHTSGTADLIIDNSPIELVTMDYKHGAGVSVDVVGNTQARHYTIGYYAQYATRPYKQYRQVIIQPRSRHEEGPIREECLTHDELISHAKLVAKRVKYIEKHPTERKAGTWCMFCAGAGTCKTLAKHNINTAMMEFGKLDSKPVDPDELDPEELAHVVLQSPLIEKWIKAVYAAALEAMTRGVELPDLKLVHGRSTRSWSNENAVYKMLKQQFREDDFAPRSLLGVAKIEQLVKRKIAEKTRKRVEKKELFQKASGKFKRYIHRSQPALHIAPVSDPRPAAKRGEEFADAPLENL